MFVFRTFSALFKLFLCYQGRRVPLRFTLAPGYYISRLRRWAFALAILFCAFCASRLPWLLYFAPSALHACPWLLYFAPSALRVCPGYSISRLRRFTLALAILFHAFGAQLRLLCKARLHNRDDRMAQVYDLLCC